MTGPTSTVIQLSDTHLTGSGPGTRPGLDPALNLRRTLAHLDAFGHHVDAIVVSGDIADTGEVGAYRELRVMLEPTAERLGAEICYAMGNHDDRAAFRTGLGLGRNGAVDPTIPYDAVHQIGGLRVIVLDTTTPDRHDGALSDVQLTWLDKHLAHAAESGTMLVMHHPPIRSPIPTVDLLRLRNPGALASVIAGSDVRMIVCGHAHYTGASVIAGIPVWIGPPLSYRTDPAPPTGRHRARFGFGLSRIDFFGDRAVATAIDVVDVDDVYDEPQSVVLERLRELTPNRP